MKRPLLFVVLALASVLCAQAQTPVIGLPTSGTTVASTLVSNQSANFANSAILTPSTVGIYQLCAGFVVTTAGSTGATLTTTMSFTTSGRANAPGVGAITVAAATVGVNNNTNASPTCQTFLPDVGTPIGITFTIGGAPTTNPTYTYWYVLTRVGP